MKKTVSTHNRLAGLANKLAKSGLVIAAAILANTHLAAQQPGDLDPSFGNGGIVTTQFGISTEFIVDVIEDMAVQPDGKIVAVGSSRLNGQKRFTFARYNPDGTLDPSFGQNGSVIFAPGSLYGNFVMSVHLVDNGKILCSARFYDPDAEVATSWPVLFRLMSDGSFDPSFGQNGMVDCHHFGQHNVWAGYMEIQSDGKMVLSGYYDDKMMSLRYNVDGSIDTGYGDGGKCVITIPDAASSYVNQMTLQDDDKAILVGMYSGTGNFKWVIARVGTDGQLDPTFGDGGIKLMDIGYGHDMATAVAMLDDGKILVGGHSWIANDPVLMYDFAMVRLNPDGSQDMTFGKTDGMFYGRYEEEGCNYINDLAVAPSGNIYAAMNVQSEIFGTSVAGLLALDPNGNQLSTFGEAGYSATPLNGSTNTEITMVMQPDLKIIIAGECFRNDGTGVPFTMARFITGETYPTGPCSNPFLVAEAATQNGQGVIRCAWTPVGGAQSYTLYLDGEPIATTADTEHYFTTGVGGQSYCFTVTATCADAVSGHSNESCAVAPATTGIEHIAPAFALYPNPAGSHLNIDFEGGNYTVEVYEVGANRMVMSERDARVLDINALAAGSYIVRVVAADEVAYGKFIKM